MVTSLSTESWIQTSVSTRRRFPANGSTRLTGCLSGARFSFPAIFLKGRFDLFRTLSHAGT